MASKGPPMLPPRPGRKPRVPEPPPSSGVSFAFPGPPAVTPPPQSSHRQNEGPKPTPQARPRTALLPPKIHSPASKPSPPPVKVNSAIFAQENSNLMTASSHGDHLREHVKPPLSRRAAPNQLALSAVFKVIRSLTAIVACCLDGAAQYSCIKPCTKHCVKSLTVLITIQDGPSAPSAP